MMWGSHSTNGEMYIAKEMAFVQGPKEKQWQDQDFLTPSPVFVLLRLYCLLIAVSNVIKVAPKSHGE